MKFAVLVSDGVTSDPGEAKEVHVYDGGRLVEAYENPALSSNLRGISTFNSLLERQIRDLVVAGIGRPAYNFARTRGVKIYSIIGGESEAVRAFLGGAVGELLGPTDEGGHHGSRGAE